MARVASIATVGVTHSFVPAWVSLSILAVITTIITVTFISLLHVWVAPCGPIHFVFVVVSH